MAQARTISEIFSKAINGLVLCCPYKGAFLSLSDSESSLVFEKELIYAGDFIKNDGVNPPIEFSVDDNLIRHWHDTIKMMLSNGIAVPMPLEHTSDPTKKRAEIVDARIGTNEQGLPALYGKTRFPDVETAKQLKHSDVSIYVADAYIDGKGNKYVKPIRHVAFTNYPVIPGLENFKAVAASLAPLTKHSNTKETIMPSALHSLAKKLNLSLADSLADELAETAIVEEFNKRKAPETVPPSIVASFGPMLKSTREQQLLALVTAGNITKAAADDLALAFCADEEIGLALSATVAGQPDKTFNSIVEALKKNKALDYSGKTGAQVRELANVGLSNGKVENPLLADAERRQKELASSN